MIICLYYTLTGLILRSKVYSAFQGENDFSTVLSGDLNSEQYRGKEKEKKKKLLFIGHWFLFCCFLSKENRLIIYCDHSHCL